ncbi:hypothetical protein AURDEDRAFT_112311 [Auricularia subglabra TFB-10046 SS5]|nr:hypothetical protein AURDEDRAFT_112311 [Auricularia subglabra TFB-10046 SS5]
MNGVVINRPIGARSRAPGITIRFQTSRPSEGDSSSRPVTTREHVFPVMPCVGTLLGPVADDLSIARQVLEGLAALHARGIAHVDIHDYTCTGQLDASGDALRLDILQKPRRRRRWVAEADFPLTYHVVPEIGWADWMPHGDPRGALHRPGIMHDPYAADVWMIERVLRQHVGRTLRGNVVEYCNLLERMTHAKPCVRPTAEEALAVVVALQRMLDAQS